MPRLIDAQPFAFTFEPAELALLVIDMQRDFIEPGGFGASLGNDVTPLQSIVPTVRQLLDGQDRFGLVLTEVEALIVLGARLAREAEAPPAPASDPERSAGGAGVILATAAA